MPLSFCHSTEWSDGRLPTPVALLSLPSRAVLRGPTKPSNNSDHESQRLTSGYKSVNNLAHTSKSPLTRWRLIKSPSQTCGHPGLEIHRINVDAHGNTNRTISCLVILNFISMHCAAKRAMTLIPHKLSASGSWRTHVQHSNVSLCPVTHCGY